MEALTDLVILSQVPVPSLYLQLIDITGKKHLGKMFQRQHDFQMVTDDLAHGYYLLYIQAGNYHTTRQVFVF